MRWVKRGAIALLLLLAVVGVGRVVQVAWDSRLTGVRGPYLQAPASDGITIRWQSEAKYRGVVNYGTAPDRLAQEQLESDAGKVHELRLAGLQPGTRYYYRAGDGQSGESGWFRTAPTPGSAVPLRIWVQGDPGYDNDHSRAVRAAMEQWVADNPRPGLPLLDLWLTTGDNAYTSGRNSEYQAALFDAYPQLLRHTPYIPVYGNHDARRWTFYDLFTFPLAGEAGGLPSGSEHFFAIDYANVHFVFLDSEEQLLDEAKPMLDWLERDLAQNSQPWTVVLFHHPPYSKGGHDSDRERDSRGRMVRVREQLLPRLEAAGVDLVLSGHSHGYERTSLIGCHYGTSESFNPGYLIDKAEDSHYRKALQNQPYAGTVYAVVGSTSKLNRAAFDHPAMARSLRRYGSLVIDVAGERLAAHFIDEQGDVADSFTIEKIAGHKGRSCQPEQG